jgi:guanosine-3',5'-bis(diphosphate) 3'-pyrophosphohydrolase
MDPDLTLLLRALDFAAAKHRDQRRKGSDAAPYVNHCIGVARLLAEVGGVRDLTILTAAVLHDTVEDTDTTPEELESLFGAEVRCLVMECTDDKSLPKPIRKQLQVEHAPHKSPGAKQIKIADKTSNVRDVTHCPPKDWPWVRLWAYLDWTEQVVAGLRGANPALEAHYDLVLAAGRERLSAGREGT